MHLVSSPLPSLPAPLPPLPAPVPPLPACLSLPAALLVVAAAAVSCRSVSIAMLGGPLRGASPLAQRQQMATLTSSFVWWEVAVNVATAF